MKSIQQLCLFCLIMGVLTHASAQETQRLPAKLQLAVEPEEITLTNSLTVGAPEKTIHMLVRETSGLNRANLELVARPFTDIATGDLVDADLLTLDLSAPQAALPPGGLQRVEVTVGGFRKAGSYLGGITIHDMVSGEQRQVAVRVSVKDSWQMPALLLLGAVLLASGINYWTRKGRRKNQVERTIADLQNTVKLAGGQAADPFLLDAAQLLEQAQVYNQDYQFSKVDSLLAEADSKLARYEQRKQGSEALHQQIQTLLQEVRELGENDPQHARISDELIRLLPSAQSEYEETAAFVKQLEQFFKAYRLAKHDLRAAQEKLHSAQDYVQKADRSRIELYFRDIGRVMASAETMSAIDEVNALLRKVAYELSPEKINENIFREQKMQKRLWEFEQRIKLVTGTQVKRIVTAWFESAQSALHENGYDDVEAALYKLERTLDLIDRIKQTEQRIKGRDPKMTELRRILRNDKNLLEQDASEESLRQVDWDVQQVQDILDGRRQSYQPFVSQAEEEADDRADAHQAEAAAPEGEGEHLKPLTRDDLQQQVDRALDEASRFPKLRLRVGRWSDYCRKLVEFEELSALSEYLRLIQEQVALYDRLQTLRAQAEDQRVATVLRLIEQAEQVLEQEPRDEAGSYHRAEVLADAAAGLLADQGASGERNPVFSYIRSPKTTSTVITYGTFGSYFVITTLLGLQILYAPDADFGAMAFKDYFSLVLWALGLEGAKLTVTNVYETYIKKSV